MMTKQELRALAEKATPGPWYPYGANPDAEAPAHVDSDAGVVLMGSHERGELDAPYLAAVDPQTVIALLDENAVLRAGLKWTERILYGGLQEDGDPNPYVRNAMMQARRAIAAADAKESR